jgi:hypothetical protein
MDPDHQCRRKGRLRRINPTGGDVEPEQRHKNGQEGEAPQGHFAAIAGDQGERAQQEVQARRVDVKACCPGPERMDRIGV